jgi:2-keto-3-deoxy-L-rhamnonate aldolase RhmA
VRENPVKRRLAAGGVALGTMVTEFATTGVARLAAAAGAEFVLFDLEHTGYGIERMLVQIETAAGLESVDDIAAVPGVDVLWIGHFDLTASLGVPGAFASDEFREAVDRVLAAGKKHEKPVGIVGGSVEECRTLIERGFRLVGYSFDLWIYQDALAAALAELVKLRDAVPTEA